MLMEGASKRVCVCVCVCVLEKERALIKVGSLIS